jgi:hypothetical protein
VVSPAELPDALDGECSLVVDLDRPTSDTALRQATEAAQEADVVLLGLSKGRPTPGPLLAALTVTVAPGSTELPEVVGVPDLELALEAIAANVLSAPRAAATLAGLLRQTAVLPVREGLVTESLAYSLLLAGPEFATWRADRPRRPQPSYDGPPVLLERVGDRLVVTLNRPHRHNAFSAELRDGLLEALSFASLDESITAVDLHGAGRSFCSGGDLEEFGTSPDPVAAHLLRVRHSAGRAVHSLSRCTTAHLHGACIGAGIEIASFAGRVVAAADTAIQLPELRMGLVPGAGGTVGIPRRIGRWRTAFLVLSSTVLDVGTAREWGLVDAVAP